MNFKDVFGMVSSVTSRMLIIEKNTDVFFYTGCPECHTNRETVNPVNDKTMRQLYEDTMEKVRRLKDQGLK